MEDNIHIEICRLLLLPSGSDKVHDFLLVLSSIQELETHTINDYITFLYFYQVFFHFLYKKCVVTKVSFEMQQKF